LAQALSIAVAAHSEVGRFVTTLERIMVSRPFIQPAQLYVETQGALPQIYIQITSSAFAAHLISERRRALQLFQIK
jgi:hypothetical protein